MQRQLREVNLVFEVSASNDRNRDRNFNPRNEYPFLYDSVFLYAFVAIVFTRNHTIIETFIKRRITGLTMRRKRATYSQPDMKKGYQ
jgi:hypothetical protein